MRIIALPKAATQTVDQSRVMSEYESALLLKVEEACKLLNVSRATLFRLMANGQLVRRRIGGATRIPRTSLEAFLKRDHATK